MASEVGIVNFALRKIGANPIVSLTEGSDNANAASDIYEDVRDELLRSHQWNFAAKRLKLGQSATTPPFGYDYQYPIPSDFVRVISVHDNENALGVLDYRLEYDDTDGRVIRTDAEDVYLRYVSKVTDPNKFPADFRTALAYLLAVDFAITIAQSNTLSDRMVILARNAKSKARSNDGIGDYQDSFPNGSWISERF